MELCKFCGKNYHDEKYPSCFDCRKKAEAEKAQSEGMVLCAVCGKNYHNPEYDSCYFCFLSKKANKYGVERVKNSYF